MKQGQWSKAIEARPVGWLPVRSSHSEGPAQVRALRWILSDPKLSDDHDSKDCCRNPDFRKAPHPLPPQTLQSQSQSISQSWGWFPRCYCSVSTKHLVFLWLSGPLINHITLRSFGIIVGSSIPFSALSWNWTNLLWILRTMADRIDEVLAAPAKDCLI
jgi:hypothetical protein